MIDVVVTWVPPSCARMLPHALMLAAAVITFPPPDPEPLPAAAAPAVVPDEVPHADTTNDAATVTSARTDKRRPDTTRISRAIGDTTVKRRGNTPAATASSELRNE